MKVCYGIIGILIWGSVTWATDAISPYYLDAYMTNVYSARNMGMGDTGIAVPNSLLDSLKNPATLVLDKTMSLESSFLSSKEDIELYSYVDWIQSRPNFAMGIGFKLSDQVSMGFVGLRERHLTTKVFIPDFEYTDLNEDGEVYVAYTGPVDTRVVYDHFTYTLPVSFQFNSSLRLGAAVTYHCVELTESLSLFDQSHDFDLFTTSGISTQFGVMFSPVDSLNFGGIYVPKSRIESTDVALLGVQLEEVSAVTLPSRYGVGCTFQPLSSWMISLDYAQIQYGDVAEYYTDQSVIRAGMAFMPWSFLTVRLGYESYSDFVVQGGADEDLVDEKVKDLVRSHQFLTCGIGVEVLEGVTLDVAVRDNSVLDSSSDVSLTQYGLGLRIQL